MSSPRKVFLFVLVFGTLVSACDTGFNFSSSSGDPSGSGPQASTPGGPGSTRTAAAPLCQARNLRATGGSRKDPNDIDGAIGDVIISNSTSTTCEVRGVPVLHLLSRSGSPIAVQSGSSVSPSVAPVVLQPKGKSTAELVFTWQNWCSKPPGALEMRIGLADKNGTITALLGNKLGSYVPMCDRPNTPSVVRVQYAYVAAGAAKLTA